MKFATHRGILSQNPCQKVKQIREEQNPIDYLTAEEQDKLLKVAQKGTVIYRLIATGCYTGLIVGELINLVLLCKSPQVVAQF
jgi:site-specific recombinase XerD